MRMSPMELTLCTIVGNEQWNLQNLNKTYFRHNPVEMKADHFLHCLHYMNYQSDFQKMLEIEKMLMMTLMMLAASMLLPEILT